MRKKKAKPESVMSGMFANHLLTKYPKIPYRVDIVADMPLPPMYRTRLRELHGKWARGYPDYLILSCRGGYGGLFLELKATETVPNTDHTRRQAYFHSVLRKQGYKCMFCCGLKECKKMLKKYMKLKRNKVDDR